MAVLFTFGASDLGKAVVRPDAKGQLNIHVDGNSNVLGMVKLGRIQPIPHMIYGPNAKQPPLKLPLMPTLVFNQISEPDSHTFALKRCEALCDQLDRPVINHPRAIQGNARDRVAELASDIPGIISPRTLSCAPGSPREALDIAEEHGIGFPFIFRSKGEHNGRNMVLIRDAGDLEVLHAFPFDGREFYLVEFIDYADDDGFYYKHRIVVIDGNIMPHHTSFHKNWKVHVSAGDGIAFMAGHPEKGTPIENLTQLDKQLLPKAMPALEELNRRIGLDYFAIDCHVFEDGRVALFEANANVNAMENVLEGTQHYRIPINHRMVRMIAERSGETV